MLVLIFHAFTNLIRFNKKNKFNASFTDDRRYNDNKKDELKIFYDVIKNHDIKFSNLSFDEFDLSFLNEDDFVYCDPPYLLGLADYNKVWNDEKEVKLYSILDMLNDKHVKFGLSNVIKHKGQINHILNEWSNKYKIFYPDINYNNCNYHLKSRDMNSIEVYVTNYGRNYKNLKQENIF